MYGTSRLPGLCSLCMAHMHCPSVLPNPSSRQHQPSCCMQSLHIQAQHVQLSPAGSTSCSFKSFKGEAERGGRKDKRPPALAQIRAWAKVRPCQARTGTQGSEHKGCEEWQTW